VKAWVLKPDWSEAAKASKKFLRQKQDQKLNFQRNHSIQE
jgi:hypothetical protein